MKEPRWLTREVVLVIHAQLIAEHGGPAGLRDEAALESAIARPRQKHHYGPTDLPTLAAAYAYGLCTNHPFADGNKRVALACMDVFLRLQGRALLASEVESVSTMLALASGELTEEALAEWIRRNS